MSLYRQAGTSTTRRVVIGGGVALIVLAVGFVLGRATAPSTSLESNVASLQDEASVITDALELVPLHYESSNETTRQGARDQIRRAVEQFGELEPELAVVGAEETRRASTALQELERLANEDAAATEVEAAAGRAADAVRAAAGLS